VTADGTKASVGRGPERTEARRAFSNAGLNLVASMLPFPLALVTVPAVIRGFGVERYGVLATAGVVLAYFALLDLGLGRASTRFLARSLGEGAGHETAETFWTVTWLAAAIGLAAGALLFSVAAPLARQVLRVPPALVADSEAAFRGLALAAPFVVLLPALLGALEARRRFDLVAAISVPTAALGLLAPLAVLPWTTRLVWVVVAIAAVQAAACAVTLAVCLGVLPGVRRTPRLRLAVVGDLLGYGRWVAVSNVVGPLMVNADRLVIGAVMSVRAVSYYAAPFDLVSRMSLVPASVMRALFPLFSADRSADVRDARRLAVDGARAIALVMGPAALLVVALAPDVLRLWLGSEFAAQSAASLQLLAVGVTVNALAMVPFWLLQGLGRPDVCAKFHLVELVIYVPMLFVLLRWQGIAGAAAAWTIRVALDGGLLLVAARRLVGAGEYASRVTRLKLFGLALAAALVLARLVAVSGTGVTSRLGGAALLSAGTAGLGWWLLLSAEERAAAVRAAAERLRSRSAS
jgi:O-antigen/teichoic acid export membrane protein